MTDSTHVEIRNFFYITYTYNFRNFLLNVTNRGYASSMQILINNEIIQNVETLATAKLRTNLFLRFDVHRRHFPMHFFRLSLNDIPGTRTDCHMTRVGAQRATKLQSMLAACTVMSKNLAQLASKDRVSSR